MTMEDGGITSLPLPQQFKSFLIEQWGISQLYPPQIKALKPVLDGKNTLISIPTASGKSLLAYFGMMHSLGDDKQAKAIYIVPLKALAQEKYDDLKAIGKAMNVDVGLAIGDASSEIQNLDTSQILVCTSEKLDSLLRHRSELFEHLKCVIADEFHLMNDATRGPTLEMNLTRLRMHHADAQIIALSATAGNVKELAHWLEAELIVSDWRPVDLEYSTFHNFHIEPRLIHGKEDQPRLLETPRTLEGLVSHPVWSVVDDGMTQHAQVLIFVGTRKSAQSEARNLSKRVLKRLKKEDDDTRIDALEQLSKRFKSSSSQSSLTDALAECIRGGVAFHHAGLTHQQRQMIEMSFKEGTLVALTATPTLAAGVNLPARRVLVRDLKRWNDGFNRPLPVMEVRQMLGRAGRPSYDSKGEAWIYCKNTDGWEEADAVSDRYFFGPVEDITSKLATEPALRMHLLALVATGGYTHKATILDFFKKTFLGSTLPFSQLEDRINQMLNWLVEERYLRDLGPDDQFRITLEEQSNDDAEPWDDTIPSWVTSAQQTEGVNIVSRNNRSGKHQSAHSTPNLGFQSAHRLKRHSEAIQHEFQDESTKYEGTPLGIRVSQLYLDPLSSSIMRTGLRRFVRRSVRNEGLITPLAMLHLVSATPDFPSLWAKTKDLEANSEIWLKFNTSEEEFVLDTSYLEEAIGLVKSAWMLEQWCEEKSFRDLEQQFDVAPGDVHHRTSIAEWLLYCAKEILLLDDVFAEEHMNNIAEIAGMFSLLRQRIRHGCKEDLLSLVNIKNIGRTRARILASKGLRRPKDVLNMSKKIRSEIEQIRGWGPQLLENIFEEIKKVEGRPVTTPPKRRDDEPLEGERAED